MYQLRSCEAKILDIVDVIHETNITLVYLSQCYAHTNHMLGYLEVNPKPHHKAVLSIYFISIFNGH